MALPTNNNKRVFYAMQGVAIGDINATGVKDSWLPGVAQDFTGDNNVLIMHGLQSLGVDTNFNLEQIFELGQLSLYENYEEVPEISVNIEKVLDGYTLVYHAGTVDATSPTLTGRSNARADVRMAIGLDTMTAIVTGASNSGVKELYCSGMYLNSVSYTLSTDGNLTESTSFVGNSKTWGSGLLVNSNGVLNSAFASTVFGDDAPVGKGNSVLRRQNVVIGSVGLGVYGGNTFYTVVPDFIEGATTGAKGYAASGGASGLYTNASYVAGNLHLNSATISCDLGREQINELGKKAPYYRYVNFPVEVTCEIEVTAVGGDNIDAYEEGYPTAANGVAAGKNLKNHSIQFVLDDSTVISLGNKNKLTSVTYGGGDAGGGNATITYSMSNFNDFVVLHSGDPITLGESTYWVDWFA